MFDYGEIGGYVKADKKIEAKKKKIKKEKLAFAKARSKRKKNGKKTK